MGGKLSHNELDLNKIRHNGFVSEQTSRKHSSKRSKKRNFLKQVKRDRRSQRVTKDQIYNLSTELTRTSWYLGRRLGFNEIEVQRMVTAFDSEHERKSNVLLSWRRRHKWKATVQNLVIYLELAGYGYDEYKGLLVTSQLSDSRPDIYEMPKVKKSVAKEGNYRFDNFEKIQRRRDLLTRSKVTDDVTLPRASKHDKTHDDVKSGNDSGFVTSQELSSDVTMPGLNHYPSKTTLEKSYSNERNFRLSCVKPGSQSTLQYMPMTSSLNDITTDNDDVIKHQRDFSTDSQIQYKNQIIRMSKRHYDEPKNGRKNSSFNFFKFGGRGNRLSQFGGVISGLDITIDDDIIVSDSDNNRVQIFDRFGNFRLKFDTGSDFKPKGLFVTQQRLIVVCCGSEVRVFTMDGRLKLCFGQGTFRNNCYSVCSDTMGNYYVTDIVGHTVTVYDETGNIRKRFGYQGSKLMNFNQPVAVAISRRNELVVSDSQNHQIKVYSLAGRPLHAIGGKGTNDGEFWNPFGICFDAAGYLYVADCGNDRISQFDDRYRFLRHVITRMNGLKMPSFVKVNSLGQLVVAEWGRQCVKVFSLETAV
uniref:uncharacterized protein LOC100184006 isoform X2 n=1 Tax=Ciona intestinalis TaxID=7719 RepID=UPI000EF49D4A|nr:uncharacterized protein LOC100184006 isoform X2 [Ciona intestinalis]|eukprot:XP_026694454.1 uncharacterized protein LOC100184006 isoform X2 [Ciona intestinalis]